MAPPASPRGGGSAAEGPMELVLKLAKLSLKLVGCATAKDAKSFVGIIKVVFPRALL